jgi:hypothetical protein
LGGISGEFSSNPVTRMRYPDNGQRIATRNLPRKMARSQAEREPAYTKRACSASMSDTRRGSGGRGEALIVADVKRL